MRFPIQVGVTLLLLLLCPGTGAAQERTTRFASAQPTPLYAPVEGEPREAPSVAGQGLAGLGLGAVGLAAGGALGLLAAEVWCTGSLDFCLGWMGVGGITGLSLGAPWGVHLGSGRRTNLHRSLAGSMGIGAAAALLMTGSDGATAVVLPVLLLTPLAQIAFSIAQRGEE